MGDDRRSVEDICLGEAPLPWRVALAIVGSLARALGELHARGVVQRHLRADRIYLDGGVVTIDAPEDDDVGVAAAPAREAPLPPRSPSPSGEGEGEGGFLDHLVARVHRPQGHVAGIVYTAPLDAYSPEQMLGKPGIDARSDVYGLGVIAYWLLTGRLPFADAMESPSTLLHAQLKRVPVAPSAVVAPEAGIPGAVDALVLACLARDRAARPVDIAAVMRAIAACNAR